MNINRSRRLPPNQFVPEPQTKDLVVLHFTAGGSTAGAINSWLSTPERVATAYLVDVDATIFEVFDPRCWAAHLGVGATQNPGHQLDRRSIGIEIVNWGGLKRAGGQLNCWPNNYTQRYCAIEEKGRYVESNFRGFGYFASFPDAQLAAAIALTRHLCDQFGIPKRTPPADKRGLLDWPFFGRYTGVASHQNFHAGKSDIGPAFDWARLEAALA
jgi:N-acetyl-anhydromuramyl-L-alanine amidase AmpD